MTICRDAQKLLRAYAHQHDRANGNLGPFWPDYLPTKTAAFD